MSSRSKATHEKVEREGIGIPHRLDLRILLRSVILTYSPSYHQPSCNSMNRHRRKEVLVAAGILVGTVVLMGLLSLLG